MGRSPRDSSGIRLPGGVAHLISGAKCAAAHSLSAPARSLEPVMTNIAELAACGGFLEVAVAGQISHCGQQ